MLPIEEIEKTQHILELETMCNWDAIKTAIQGLDELLEYKRLEEKLGCPLEVVVEALENGIYTKESELDKEFELFVVRGIEQKGVSVISKFCSYAECDFTCYYKDYKKTWWLRGDKSE